MKALARALKVPDKYALPWANGIMERLWHYTAKMHPQGDIGASPDWAIADACGWEVAKRADRSGMSAAKVRQLIDGLLSVGWLDLDGRARLIVHDWADHADASVKRTLENKGLKFLVPEEDSQADGKKMPALALPCLSLALPVAGPVGDLSPGTSSAPPKPEPAAPNHPKMPPLQTNGFAPPDATDWAARYEGVYALYPLPGWKPEGQMRYIEIISASVDLHTAAAAIDRSVLEWANFWKAHKGEHVPGIGKWFSDGYYLRKPEAKQRAIRAETPTEEAIRFAREKRDQEQNARAN